MTMAGGTRSSLASCLRSPRLWLWAALVLPLLTLLTLVAVLVLSPAHRIRFLVPRLAGMVGLLPGEGVVALRDWAAEALGTEAGFCACVELFQHPDPQVRISGFSLAMDKVPLEKAFPLDEAHLALVRAAIDDPLPDIARWSIELLAELGDLTSLDAVLARYRRTPSPAITWAALYYLGHLAPERFDREAEQLGREADSGRWTLALRSLGYYPSDRGLQLLMAWSRSDDPLRSSLALKALVNASCQIDLAAKHASPCRVRAERSAFLNLLREAIMDRRRDLITRQRLLLCVLDQEAAYRLCQDLLRQTHDHRRTAELVMQALHGLEPCWSEPLCLYHATNEEAVGWMMERWPVFSSPRPGDPPPADGTVLAAVRDALLASDRPAAAGAITLALRPQLTHLSGDERAWVQRLIEALASPDPSFDF